MPEFTSQDITNFLKTFIEIGGVNKVDENSIIHHVEKDKDTVWSMPSSDDPNVEYPLAIYNANQTNPDVIVINPFIEGLVTTNELLWFYNTRSLNLSIVFYKIIKTILTSVIKVNKKSKKEPTEEFSTEVIRLISPFVESGVDEKMVQELALMCNKIVDFCNIFWNNKKGACYFRCGVFEDSFKESFNKRIRVKSWEVITSIVKTILGTDNPKETFFYKSSNIGCSRIDSYSRVYMMLYKKLNPYLVLIDMQNTIDFEAMDKHIEMIPYYYSRAKNIITKPAGAPIVKKDKIPWDAPKASPTPVSVLSEDIKFKEQFGGERVEVDISPDPVISSPSNPPVNPHVVTAPVQQQVYQPPTPTYSMQPPAQQQVPVSQQQYYGQQPPMQGMYPQQQMPMGGPMQQGPIPITNAVQGGMPLQANPFPGPMNMMPNQQMVGYGVPGMYNQGYGAPGANVQGYGVFSGGGYPQMVTQQPMYGQPMYGQPMMNQSPYGMPQQAMQNPYAAPKYIAHMGGNAMVEFSADPTQNMKESPL